MKKIIIFGNSGAGKSTQAKKMASQYQLAHLDLDILAWQDTVLPEREPIEESSLIINKFLYENEGWVIEGGYTDLLGLIKDEATQVIFLNPGMETCIENSNNRPWEPHKYESIEMQNENLTMLLG